MEDDKAKSLQSIRAWTETISKRLDEWQQNGFASEPFAHSVLWCVNQLLRETEEFVLQNATPPNAIGEQGRGVIHYDNECPNAKQATYHIIQLLACLPRTTFAQLKVSMQEEDCRNEFPFYAAELDLLSASRACLEASFYREQKVMKGCSP